MELIIKCADISNVHPHPQTPERQREFCIDNLPFRIHFIIVMIKWTRLAPWEFEFLLPGSFTSTNPQTLNPKP